VTDPENDIIVPHPRFHERRGAGLLRVVADPQAGVMYYTWTHYADLGAPAFVQIR
jgi:hypothetical protein